MIKEPDLTGYTNRTSRLPSPGGRTSTPESGNFKSSDLLKMLAHRTVVCPRGSNLTLVVLVPILPRLSCLDSVLEANRDHALQALLSCSSRFNKAGVVSDLAACLTPPLDLVRCSRVRPVCEDVSLYIERGCSLARYQSLPPWTSSTASEQQLLNPDSSHLIDNGWSPGLHDRSQRSAQGC